MPRGLYTPEQVERVQAMVRASIQESGLTQNKWAESKGLHPGRISDVWKGVVTPSAVKKFAAALGVAEADLLRVPKRRREEPDGAGVRVEDPTMLQVVAFAEALGPATALNVLRAYRADNPPAPPKGALRRQRTERDIRSGRRKADG